MVTDILCFVKENIIDLIMIFMGAIGGTFALIQWKKSNDYKRADLVQSMITKLRDDKDISIITDIIDWNEALKYDGRFSIENCTREDINQYTSDEIFIKIDKTLSHYSYVCYLYKQGIFKKNDIAIFDYNIKRIVNNEQIANYLYSLFHWSESIDVNCSFEYLIDYSLKRGYLDNNFKIYTDNGIGKYKTFLLAMEGYEK